MFLAVNLAFADAVTVNLKALMVSVCIPPLVSAGIATVILTVLQGLEAKVTEARRMGAYGLVTKLGEGGMGEVWRAEHQILARPAALKLIRDEWANTDDGGPGSPALTRFEREAQATAQLCCPHTISLYDFGIADDGAFYYVMELLDGFDLETLVLDHGIQSPERTVHFLAQACLSLAEAHACGMVHRDIKPANIFCCHYGLSYDFIKVLDFGLVKTSVSSRQSPVSVPKVLPSELSVGDVKLTDANKMTGTPAYIAPETVLGEEIGPPADIYALGGVAYWLLTGQLLFEADSPMIMAFMHAKSEPMRPSKRLGAQLPEALESIILRCLAKEPSDRPTAVELRDQLCASVPTTWSQEQASAWWSTHRRQVSPAQGPELNAALLDTVVSAKTVVRR